MGSVPAFQLRLFGGPLLTVEGRAVRLGAPPGTFPLLAFLAIAAPRSVARDEIADALWPERDAESARASLRRHLYHLERALRRIGIAATFERTRSHLGMTLESDVRIDVLEFEAAIAAGDDEAALALYVDEFLPRFEEEWVLRERRRLRALAARAAQNAIARARRDGATESLVRNLERALALEPWREEFVREAMLVRHAAGERAEALQIYRTFAASLRDDLQTEPLPETRELFDRLVQAVPGSPAPSRMPAPFTSFVGRTSELASTVALVRERRVVTVTGSPGVGKTRLVERIAADPAVRAGYGDGIVFVDVGSIERPEGLEPAVLAALALPGRLDDRGVEALVRDRAMLFVIDNCERMHTACAALVEMLAGASPNISVLATSRRVLGAHGEAIVRLEPLPLPTFGADRDRALASDAMRLFVDRARAARPELSLKQLPLDAAISICRRLDGIPLALELAAARLRSLTVLQLADLLDERFRVLSRDGRHAPDHRSTLLATYDVSYDLLSERERELFCRLSVFAGGWTLEAAAAIGNPHARDAWETFEDLGSLVDQSLVVPPAAEGTSRRYAYLDSIRDYARRRLHDRGTLEATRHAHARYYATRYVALGPELRGARAHEHFAELESEYANVGVALGVLIGEGVDAALGVRLALAVSRYWTDRGIAESESVWLRRGIDAGIEDAVLLGDALQCLAAITRNLGDYHHAYELYAEVLERVRATGDATAIGKATATLANAARMIGDYERSLELARETRALFVDAGNEYLGAFADTAAAATYLSIGNLAEAEREFALARSRFEALGATSDADLCMLNLGLCAYYARDYAAAARLCTTALAGALEIGNRYNAAHGYQNIAAIEVARRDRAAAARFLDEAIARATNMVDRDLMICCLETYAAFECAFGSPERAAYALAAAETARLRYHAVRLPVETPIWTSLRDRVAEGTDAVSFRVAGIEGGAQALDRALDDAREALRVDMLSHAAPIAPFAHDRLAGSLRDSV